MARERLNVLGNIARGLLDLEGLEPVEHRLQVGRKRGRGHDYHLALVHRIVASSEASISACARRGFNLLLDQFASPQQIGERIAIYRRELEAAGHAFEPMRVAVARNIFVARDATEKHEAVRRQAQIHERLLSLSRGSESRAGSHILGYADAPEAHSLIGTAGEVEMGLAALEEVGVAYVLLFGQGSRDNLRRFAERVMPKFGAPGAP